MATQLDKNIEELKGTAEGLPLRTVEFPDYQKTTFQPEKIRQERTFTPLTRGMQVISRFLAERGTVEILKPEYTLALFTEIHWCAYHIRQLADAKYKTPAAAKKAVTQSRTLVSRMEAAEEELFIANRRLIVACIKPFYWIGQVWIPDFLQEGSKALSNAIRKFDFTRGTPFYAYAQVSIQNRLRNYFRDHVRSGNLGIRPTEDMMRIKQVLDKWREDHKDDPPPDILARMTGIEEAKIRKLRPLIAQWERTPYPPTSLDALLGDSTSSLHEFLEDKNADNALALTEQSELLSAVDCLPERSSFILKMRFIEGRTLEETGDALGLTRARIKQIQDESLRKLKTILTNGEHNT